MEIFKDVPGWKGIYQVSNIGRVKSLARIISHSNYFRRVKERILKPGIDSVGYPIVIFCKEGVKKKYTVHKLVAICFLNHKPDGQKVVVDHINFIRHDNRLENLRLTTMRDNSNLKHKESSSKYVGVSFHNRQKKWAASIHYGGKGHYLGSFATELEAHEAYQKALKNVRESRTD